MAIVHKHGKGTKVLLDGYDMSQILNNVDWDHSADTVDVTTFGDDDMNYLAGLRQGTMSLSGLWSDDGSGGGSTAHIDEVFDDVLGSSTDVIVSVGPGGSTLGDGAMLAALQETQRAASSPVSGAVTTDFVGTANGRTAYGFWLAAPVSRAANTTEASMTGVNLGGSTTAQTGYAMHLHVVAGTTSATASPELSLTVQDSSDNATWVDLPTQFTDISSTAPFPQSQRVVVSTAACQDYARVQHTQHSTALTYGVAFARLP